MQEVMKNQKIIPVHFGTSLVVLERNHLYEH
jgi:hypothetical protein